MLLRCFMMRLDTIPNAARVAPPTTSPSNPPARTGGPPYPYAATSPLAATPKAYNCAFCRCMLGLEIALVGVLDRLPSEGGEDRAEQDEREREQRIGVCAVAIRVIAAVGVTQRNLRRHDAIEEERDRRHWTRVNGRRRIRNGEHGDDRDLHVGKDHPGDGRRELF